MKKLNIVQLLCGMAVAVYAADYLVTNHPQLTDQELEQKEYCEMVTLNIDSAGQYGWPDFKQSYLKDCTK